MDVLYFAKVQRTDMFKFDLTLPIEKIQGQIVWWISFSSLGMKISFENDYISIYHLSDFCNDNFKIMKYFRLELIQLVNTSVSKIDFLNQNHLRIKFSNDYVLNFLDKNDEFEKFEFLIDRNIFIV